MTEIIRDLGDGLILRSATVEDTDELATFNSHIHKDPGQDDPNEFIDAWVRDLMAGSHPTLKPSDFTVVVDTNTNKIVSSLNLIPQTWSYQGIEFGVGRPELVGTDPQYRRRGLVRLKWRWFTGGAKLAATNSRPSPASPTTTANSATRCA